MAPRTQRRRCRNCKDELPPKAIVEPARIGATENGDLLWRAALTACAGSLETLFRFVALDVPGDTISQLKRLHVRLGEVIKAREERQ